MSPPPSFLALLAVIFPDQSWRISLLPLIKDEPLQAEPTQAEPLRAGVPLAAMPLAGVPLAATDFLRPDEVRKWQSFASDKRGREWLAGRLCTYGCAWQLAGPWPKEKDFSARNWWLANADDGRPFWQGNVPEDLRGTNISLSHGGGYALAALARLPVGVDVQPCQAKVEKVAAQFATDEEEKTLVQLMPADERLARLTLLWSAKETLRKAAPDLPAFLAMHLVDGRRQNEGWWLTFTCQGKTGETTVAATMHDGHAFAFCLLEE